MRMTPFIDTMLAASEGTGITLFAARLFVFVAESSRFARLIFTARRRPARSLLPLLPRADTRCHCRYTAIAAER